MIDYEGNTLTKGDRIELHPAADLWMRGARYGTIVKLGRGLVHVKMDKLNGTRPITVHPTHLRKITL